jgi:hypothetical protein
VKPQNLLTRDVAGQQRKVIHSLVTVLQFNHWTTCGRSVDRRWIVVNNVIKWLKLSQYATNLAFQALILSNFIVSFKIKLVSTHFKVVEKK